MKKSLFLVVAMGLLACSNEPPAGSPAAGSPAASLAPLPGTELDGASEEVREQIAAARRRVEELHAAPARPLAGAYGDLGLVYLAYDLLDAATVCFENAGRLDADDDRWPYLAGYTSALRGDLAAAGGQLERALELRPGDPPTLLRLGRVELDLGRRESAGRRFALAAEQGESAAALEGLGLTAMAADDPASAVGYFERALELQPAADSLHFQLGQAYRRLGDLERARRHLEQRGETPVRIDDPLLDALPGLGRGARFHLTQAVEAFNRQDYGTAAAAYRQALAQDPSDFVAYRGLAFCLERQGDLDGALEQLRLALERGTTGDAERDRRSRAEIHRLLGGLTAASGNELLAVGHFEAAVELDPSLLDARLKLANAYARQGRFEEALAQFDALVAERPDNADLRVKRATVAINLGRPQAALEDFRRAVELEPQDAGLRLRLADALEHLGARDEAAAQRASAERLEGDCREQARLAVERARAELRAGRPEAAATALRDALSAAPDGIETRYELAAVLGHLGRYDEALAELEIVLQAVPRHAEARHAQIAALLLSRRYGPARVQLHEALKLFPRDYRLALIQARLLATSPDPAVRDGALAARVARLLVQARPDDARARETLALALAESGDFEAARTLLRELVARAEAAGEPAGSLRRELESLERGRAWTATSPREILDAAGPASGQSAQQGWPDS